MHRQLFSAVVVPLVAVAVMMGATNSPASPRSHAAAAAEAPSRGHASTQSRAAARLRTAERTQAAPLIPAAAPSQAAASTPAARRGRAVARTRASAPKRVTPRSGRTTYTVGYDVSWPQCSGPLARQMPSRRSRYVILGLTDGSGHTLNPCLGSQLRWARAARVPVGAYLVPSYPTRSERGRAGRGLFGRCGGSLMCRLRNDGASQVADAVRTMRGAGMHAPMVWLDVEFRSYLPWSRSAVRNAAVLQGAVAELRKLHESYGVYSTAYMWRHIVGSYRLNAPNWLPIGYRHSRAAMRLCRHTASGGQTWLVQYTRSLDVDLTCPVLDSVPGRHNALWPFRGLTLHLLSAGPAVKAVQAFLKQPRSGSYDAGTTLAVSSWQLHRRLPVTGAIAPLDWRAMGAYRTRGGHGFLLNRIVGRP